METALMKNTPKDCSWAGKQQDMNKAATSQTPEDANWHTNPHLFQQGQLVLLDEHFFLQKKQKLTHK
jgi:hypothetical protein